MIPIQTTCAALLLSTVSCMVRAESPTTGIRAFDLGDESPATFNLILGTQSFEPAYQFTSKPRLLEAAEVMKELGASVIKFELAPRYARGNGCVPAAVDGIDSVMKLARDEPTHRAVLDMPFPHVVLWVHTFAPDSANWWHGFPPDRAGAVYREMYDLTRHLLTRYNGSHRTFYLGHWEGDGLLRGSIAPENDAKVTDTTARGMADWLNARQRGVEDARRDTPHEHVRVWHYTEVNHVKLALRENRPAVVNRVLPLTRVDLVSYSCYDTQMDPVELKAALDYIEKMLSPKPGLTGRRVFIGEYGFPTAWNTPEEQDTRSRAVMKAGLEWGCPLILYWQLYNNEVTPEGRQRGFWLIDDQGRRQPIWHTHDRLLKSAREFVDTRVRATGAPPTEEDLRAELIRRLEAR